jgi:predicted anti-sigma-YlaC factor YlaD
MPDNVAETCIDCSVGRLLSDAISGEINDESRNADRQVFEKHIKQCSSCRKAFVQHLAETKAMPFLTDFARTKKVSLQDLLESLRHHLQNKDSES